MFKIFCFTFWICISPLLSFTQETDKIGFESGLMVYKYFPKEKTQVSNNHPLNFGFKIEYSGRTFSRKKWSLLIPFGFSYSYYTFENLPAQSNSKINDKRLFHDLNFFVGPQVQYQNKPFRFCGVLLINNQYLSSRIFGLYNLNKHIWLGPSFELFFFDIIYSVDEFKNNKNIPNYHRGNIFGLNGSAIRFSSCVKLQIDLKQ